MDWQGLTRAVAESRDFDPGHPSITVRLQPVEEPTSIGEKWEGLATTYDAFTTRSLVRLGVLVETVPCTSQGRLAVFFRLSPQPAEHEIWSTLADIRAGFRCKG